VAGGGLDGHDGVLVQTVSDDGSHLAVRYEVLGATTEPMRTREYGIDYTPGSQEVVDLTPDLGDVDGDHVADAGHRVMAADFGAEALVKDSGLVSGATLDLVWSGSPGRISLPADAGGHDLARVDVGRGRFMLARQNGATGESRWSTTMPGRLYLVQAADATGDGWADVVATGIGFKFNDDTRTADFPGQGTVFDGPTGQPLWSLTDLPSAAQPWSQTKPYTLGAGDVWNTGPMPGGLTNDCSGSDQSSGGTCFQLHGDEAAATLAIADDNGGVVAGLYQFTDSAMPTPNVYSSGSFCGATAGSVEVPPGATEVWVFAEHQGAANCDGGSVATTGKITAAFG
jgi:hypothetical protein